MSKRIDKIKIDKETLRTSIFYSGPAEYLCLVLKENILSVKQFVEIFGDNVDEYMRMDYSMRSLPALRIYNKTYQKDFESWYINGEIYLDLILPPDIRREENQRFTDLLTSAVLQQLRSPKFFKECGARVPGLNELGKVVNVDKGLAFEWESNEVPLTQITINFRINLEEWDLYLESTNRTKDTPFEETLAGLQKLYGVIQGLNDTDNVDVEIEIKQKDMEG